MNKYIICPLGIISRGLYSCSKDCALYYNGECLIKTCLLNLTENKQKETAEKIQKLQRDMLLAGTFGDLPIGYCTKGSESYGD